MAVTALTAGELKALQKYIFLVNITSGISVSNTDLSFKFSSIMSRKGIEQVVAASEGIARLSDGSYVRKLRRCIGKIWGALEYEIQHSSIEAQKNLIRRKQAAVMVLLDEIETPPSDPAWILDAVAAHPEIQSGVLQILAQGKSDLMAAGDFRLETLTSGFMIQNHPLLVKLVPAADLRAEAVDGVLKFLQCSGLVWMGRFINDKAGGDLDHFYFDIGIFSEKNFSPLEKLRSSALFKSQNKSMKEIVKKLEEFYNGRIKEYYQGKYIDFTDTLTKIKGELEASADGRSELTVMQSASACLSSLEKVNLDFERENRTLFFGKEVFDLRTFCERTAADLKARIEGLPPTLDRELKRLLASGEIFSAADETHDFFRIIDSSLRAANELNRKDKVLQQLNSAFQTGFTEIISHLKIRMNRSRDKSGHTDLNFESINYYSHFNSEEKTIYIYDHSNTFEMKAGTKPPSHIPPEDILQIRQLEKVMRCYLSIIRMFNAFEKIDYNK